MDLGGTLAGWGIKKLADGLYAQVQTCLNPTDLAKAIRASIEAAQAQEAAQAPEECLFSGIDREAFPGFVQRFFEDGGVQRELLKPLQEKGLPDRAFLTAAFQQAATGNQRLELRQERIEPWIQAFVETYLERTRTVLQFQVAKQDYLRRVEARFDHVRFLGIAVESQREELRTLPDIFVMPDVEEEVGSGRWGDLMEQHQLSDIARAESVGTLLGMFGDYELDDRQSTLFLEQQQWAQRERTGQKLLAQKLLQRNEKVVLLGAPGSGKTSLLNYFAVLLCLAGQLSEFDNEKSQKVLKNLGLNPDVDWLPLLIPIRDWVQQPDLNLEDFARHFAEKRLNVKSLPQGFFRYWLEDGRALVLLDGLDEVADEKRRYDMVSRIESFLGQYGQNRAIISSRPAGYKRDFFRTTEFPHYTLLPFDQAKIDEFIQRWYRSRTDDEVEAQERQESLKRALEAQERIHRLARNPLLLTIIALIHRYQARLPRERYKLYEKAVDTLLTVWDDGKFGDENRPISKVLEYLTLYDLGQLLQGVAYWIHCYGSTQDAEGGTLIDRDELLKQLSHMIRDQHSLELYKARQEAKRIISFIRERTGLLNEQGQDCYAFVHKTFQEYLAAEEINYLHDAGDDFEIVLTHIQEHLHDPHWREVLLLLVAKQKGKRAAKAIRAILNHGSDYEQWLHRDLLFAASCLAEDPKDLQKWDKRLGEEIIEQLVALEVTDSKQVGGKVREQVFKVLCSFSESSFEGLVLAKLTTVKEQIEQWRFFQFQAQLGQQQQAIATLLTLLKDSNSSVRDSAAGVLGQLGQASEAVVQGLLPLLQDDHSDVRDRAAGALGQLGKQAKHTEFVSAAVTQWIEQHQHEATVGAGIDALWKILE